MANVRSALNVMGEFYDRERANPEWRDWFLLNDVAIPLAWLVWKGIATPTDESIIFIQETWDSFCLGIGIDTHAEFDTLEDMIDFLEIIDLEST